MFVATNHVFCRDRSILAATTHLWRQIFVATNVLSRQKFFGFTTQKHTCLSRQNFIEYGTRRNGLSRLPSLTMESTFLWCMTRTFGPGFLGLSLEPLGLVSLVPDWNHSVYFPWSQTAPWSWLTLVSATGSRGTGFVLICWALCGRGHLAG